MFPVVTVTCPNIRDNGRTMWSAETRFIEQWVWNTKESVKTAYSPLPVGRAGRSSGGGDSQVTLVPTTTAGWGRRCPKTQERDSTPCRAGSWRTDNITLKTQTVPQFWSWEVLGDKWSLYNQYSVINTCVCSTLLWLAGCRVWTVTHWLVGSKLQSHWLANRWRWHWCLWEHLSRSTINNQ